MGRMPSPRPLWAVWAVVLGGLLACAPAMAQDEPDAALDALFGAEAFTVYGDVRAVAAQGEPSWTEGGFGKLRFDGGEDPGLRIGEAGVVWQPRFGWAVTGTVAALAQGGGGDDVGLSEAFLTYKPLTGGPWHVSARAGLMWPEVSLEHGGPEWAVRETITPSVVNSWIGEEVKVAGVDATVSRRLGGHELALTLGGFDFNDTAGTLLSFRGWALHDRKALVGREQPLPPLNAFIAGLQPRMTHPLLDFDEGAFRPGYYAKLAWQPPAPVRIEVFHYDNRADPEANNDDSEWGWRTRFENVSLRARPGGGAWELQAQAMRGRTRMGFPIDGVRWVDTRFRSAFAMATRRLPEGSATARIEWFGTRNHGSGLLPEDDEDGWAGTLAARRELTPWLTAFAEYVHVESDKPARARAGLAARQGQDQVQIALRARW